MCVHVVCVYMYGGIMYLRVWVCFVLFFTLIDNSLPIWVCKLYLFISGCAGAWLPHRTSSSRSEWGRPSTCAVQAPYCVDSSCPRAQALERTGSVLWREGRAAHWHVRSFWTSDQARTLCWRWQARC